MRAIALISGGLDSTLAAALVAKQGIEVIPLNFKMPFFPRRPQQATVNSGARVIDISHEFLKIWLNPRHGYGANLNPCIDCKILMLKKAKELMPENKAAFIITGEVLGQRPMSQHKQALKIIEEEAGLAGLILRPLSAKLLDETVAEKEGWVSRDKLLDFSGRSRKPQIKLAKALNIKDYPNPAGGCLLTDPAFSRRLKDLTEHKELNPQNIELLKIGRHFRLACDTKLVVGRDEEENKHLVNLAREDDYLFYPGDELAGPTSLGRGRFNEELIRLSCSITCRYCDLDGKNNSEIIYNIIPEEEKRSLKVSPSEDAQLVVLRLQ